MPDEWLTYAQIGERFGLSPEAARLRVRRGAWRTQPGNDGRTLALVPDGTAVQPRVRPPGQPADLDAAIERYEQADDRADAAERRAETADADRRAADARADAAIALATEANARADRLDMLVEAERARIAAVEAKLQASKSSAAELRSWWEQARAEAQEAIRRAETVEAAEAERKGRGLVARLRTAWR